MAEDPAGLQIRPLRPGDDPEAQLDLAERAFGVMPAAQRDRQLRSLPEHIATGRSLGAFAGGQPAAGATCHDMRQWWHGRPVPMAGVAGVMVAPEYRGRGVGRLPAVGAVPGDDAAVPVAGLGTGRRQGHRGHPGPVAARPGPARRPRPAPGRTRRRDVGIDHRSRWMLRVVDAPAAVAARGFPDAVSVRVPPRIADGPHPANAGRWQLAVAGGAGTLGPLAPAADEGAALAVGPRGLAALYAGTPVMTLRQASLAAGGTADGDPTHLPFPLHGTPAFAATAYMLDAF